MRSTALRGGIAGRTVLKRLALALSGAALAALGYFGLAVGNVDYGGVDRMVGASVSIQVGASPIPAAFAGAILAFGMGLSLAAVSRR